MSKINVFYGTTSARNVGTSTHLYASQPYGLHHVLKGNGQLHSKRPVVLFLIKSHKPVALHTTKWRVTSKQQLEILKALVNTRAKCLEYIYTRPQNATILPFAARMDCSRNAANSLNWEQGKLLDINASKKEICYKTCKVNEV